MSLAHSLCLIPLWGNKAIIRQYAFVFRPTDYTHHTHTPMHIYSFSHSLIHTLTHSLTYTCSVIHSFTYTLLFTHSLTHSHTLITHSHTLVFTQTLVQPFTHSLITPFCQRESQERTRCGCGGVEVGEVWRWCSGVWRWCS